ncbi:hypothetical protein FHX42_005101 [Saccharopolyspora lacisalsi]|uniref:DUF1707 domain-containing protein n=1 Tax=Halosaccharopolyspora lacisalsi TaxID=1000566 RepID=A0A839E507_9PSEU|nr:DUF1707 domain-containing protein [Halosaccharopolyspora lacisalsi]MBA8827696.1 hypothetical protein [Halosaccharopolyspora lacisalsi]
MNDFLESPELRIADADRNEAQRLLSEHLAAGRLTSGEHEERASRASQARTREEIQTLFGDLPNPQSRFDGAAPQAAAPTRRQQAAWFPEPGVDFGTTPTSRRLWYAITAVVLPCALLGAATGLTPSAGNPLVLLAALVLFAVLYVLLVVSDRTAK